MQQLFSDHLTEPGQSLFLGGDEAHYLGKALRARPGESFRVAGPDGRAVLAELRGFNGGEAELVVKAWDHDAIEPFRLHLGLCPPRGDALDQALDHAVQLGVLSLRLLRSERTLASLDGGALKPERLTKHIREFARQCKRAQLPPLLPSQSLADFIAAPFEGRRLFLSERGGVPLSTALTESPSQGAFLLLIGPEGGFSAAEAQSTQAAGWTAVSLGPRALRVPTAVAAAMAGLRALQAAP